MFVRANGVPNARWTWRRLAEDTVTQAAASTPDGGATWSQNMLLTYVRR